MQKLSNNCYFYLGVFLLVAFFLQDILQLKWPLLVELQTNELYKQLSGLVLVLFIGSQWYLSVLRAEGKLQSAQRYYKRHRQLGALAPLFFYIHSHQIGYAYLFLLSSIYFGNVVLGLCNQQILGINKPWYAMGWMVTHVSLSVCLVLLASFHVYTSFNYS